VCITRPKKRLIIFDERPESREAMLAYWKMLDAVEMISQETIDKAQA